MKFLLIFVFFVVFVYSIPTEKKKKECGGTNPVANLHWQHWSGTTLGNERWARNETIINVDNINRLTIKWIFESNGVSGISMTPTIAGNVLYGVDNTGIIFALNSQTGTEIWQRTLADITGVSGESCRNSPLIVGDWIIIGTSVFYSTLGCHVQAIERSNGNLVWRTQVDTNPTSLVTSSPVTYEDKIFVGISTSESVFTSCCTFRGSVVALDVCTGEVLWKFYTVNPDRIGFTGGPVWGSAFPIDVSRNALYAPVGNIYTLPEDILQCEKQRGVGDPTCIPNDVHPDAVVALDIDTGNLIWSFRTVAYEGYYSAACESTATLQNCPDPRGGDYDVPQAPIQYTTTDGTDVLAFGSKAGGFFVIRRNDSSIVCKRYTGPGSNLGGAGFGSAYDGQRLYTQNGNADHRRFVVPNPTTTPGATNGGFWMALNPDNCEIEWVTVDPRDNEQQSRPVGPITVANGVMFAGTLDANGMMYAFDTRDGSVIWEFESGGSVMSSPAIVNGVVYWGSGYSKWGGSGNNKLYAFEIGSD